MTLSAAPMSPSTLPPDRSAVAASTLRPAVDPPLPKASSAPRRGEDRFTPSSPAPSRGNEAQARRDAGSPASDTSASASTSDTAPSESPSKAKGEEAADNANAPRDTTGEPLSKEEQQQVEDLQARDREVRQHEQAHKAAAGQYATSGPTYSFQQGPDGRRYAVGGEVGIDTSQAETPEATIRKMQQVRRAALAPAEPSAQDRRVAAQASQSATAARAELAEQRRAERSEENGEGGAKATDAAGDAAGAASSTAVEGRASAEPSENAKDRSGVEGGVGAGGGAGTPGAAVSNTAKLKGREAVGRLVNVLA